MLGGGRRLASESQGLANSKVAEPAAQLGKAVEVEHARTVGRAKVAVTDGPPPHPRARMAGTGAAGYAAPAPCLRRGRQGPLGCHQRGHAGMAGNAAPAAAMPAPGGRRCGPRAGSREFATMA